MFDIYLFALAVAGAPEPAAAARPAIIDHVALEVADPTASADFYRRVLGLPPYAGKVPPGMRWMGDERFQLHLMGKHTKPVHPATDNHMAFRVSDIREEIRVLDRHNVKWADADGNPGEITTRLDGVLQIYFQDPDGYWIEVNQAPK